MRQIRNASAESLMPFVQDSVAPGERSYARICFVIVDSANGIGSLRVFRADHLESARSVPINYSEL
jgi:hypothetical protein